MRSSFPARDTSSLIVLSLEMVARCTRVRGAAIRVHLPLNTRSFITFTDRTRTHTDSAISWQWHHTTPQQRAVNAATISRSDGPNSTLSPAPTTAPTVHTRTSYRCVHHIVSLGVGMCCQLPVTSVPLAPAHTLKIDRPRTRTARLTWSTSPGGSPRRSGRTCSSRARAWTAAPPERRRSSGCSARRAPRCRSSSSPRAPQ